jgi:hypothetical protein
MEDTHPPQALTLSGMPSCLVSFRIQEAFSSLIRVTSQVPSYREGKISTWIELVAFNLKTSSQDREL